MSMRQFASSPAVALVVAILAAAIPSGAQSAEGGGASAAAWYGSTTATAAAALDADDRGSIGFESEARLILEARPEDGVSFRAEGGFIWDYGLFSESALAYQAGILAQPDPSGLAADEDQHRQLFLDQAYGSAILGPMDLSVGIVPIAWGTGYLFNPTSRTAPPEFPGDGTDTAPGSLGAVLRFALPAGLSAEVYATVQDRVRTAVPSVDETDLDRLPFGAKMQFRSTIVDASVSILRELPSSDDEASLWSGADAAGFLGPLSWYAEAALRLPGYGAAPKGSDWKAEEELEACAGLSWTIPRVEATLRAEAAWLGSGADDSDDYDATALLSGTRALLARRYLFAFLEKEDPEAARWKLTGGGLANLDDLSFAILSEAKLIPVQSLELGVFIRYFIGDDDSELGGERPLGADLSIRPYRSAIGLSAKWNF